MKLIFVVLIVCAFALNFSYGVFEDDGNEDTTYYRSPFENELHQHFSKRKFGIVRSWLECRKNYSVPQNEAIDIFQNPPWGDVRTVTKTAKCLVDCTMRKTGVMTDEGLNEEEYMLHIKQLRYNYTSFDLESKSREEKDRILNIISIRALYLTNYEGIWATEWHDYSCKRKSPYRNVCNDLIQSYALAARKCKSLKDPKGDNCETSFMVMRCIMQQNRSRTFNGPFYPIKWKRAMKSVLIQWLGGK